MAEPTYANLERHKYFYTYPGHEDEPNFFTLYNVMHALREGVAEGHDLQAIKDDYGALALYVLSSWSDDGDPKLNPIPHHTMVGALADLARYYGLPI